MRENTLLFLYETVSRKSKMKNLISLLFVCLLITSCVDKIERPLASGSQTEPATEELKVVPHLPVQIDSTDYLLHPIGKLSERKSGYYSSGTSAGVYRSSDGISGELTNIKFQKLDSEELLPLTNDRVIISSVEFLRAIFQNTGKAFLLYEVCDRDSNGDDELDRKDVSSLYISSINGENFRKLTAEDQNFEEFTIVDEMNRVYFKTTEDINDDREFDEKDRAYLFYIDLGAEAPKVIEYDPLKG